jgi:MPBQ/MSBQ methyltransferase
MRFPSDSLAPYVLISTGVVGGAYVLYRKLARPSRPFEDTGSVGNEYNKWTTDGILEHYWGEHIHLGYYKDLSWFNPRSCFLSNFISATRARILTQSFKDAKFEFSSQLMAWSMVSEMPAEEHVRVLDVGCGIGGTTRLMGKLKPQWSLTGISISPEQIKRASQFSIKQGVMNVDFRCCDAMAMPFPDGSFDVVWSCESAEHMPDKEGFLRECLRVLKPGGRLVLATWCQRDDKEKPFSAEEQNRLDFLYKEWCHPKFESIEEYERICARNGLKDIAVTDWTNSTLPSWRHSIFVGMWSPWAVVIRPSCWWSTIREIVTLERMHTAFRDGLMQYGILSGSK